MTRHIKRTWKVENTWNCTSCRKKNRGSEMVCFSCGNPKDESEKYDLGDTKKAVTDPARLAEANAGPNWTCSWCRYDNRAIVLNCGQCGGGRYGGPTPPDKGVDLSGGP